MKFKKVIAQCEVCADDFLKQEPRNILCSKQECTDENRRRKTKTYAELRKEKDENADNANREVRFNNIFILGQLNTCNTELVKLSLS